MERAADRVRYASRGCEIWLLGGIGAFCGAIVNVLVGINLAAAATAHTPADAAARFLVTAFNSGPSQLLTYIYCASEYAAPVSTI